MSGRWSAVAWLIVNLLFPLVFTGGVLYLVDTSATASYFDDDEDDDGAQPMLAKARVASVPPLTSTILLDLPISIVPFTACVVPGPIPSPSRDRAPPLV